MNDSRHHTPGTAPDRQQEPQSPLSKDCPQNPPQLRDPQAPQQQPGPEQEPLPTAGTPPRNVRIVDIARMAGVSAGTVDRVIHRRGKVSEENLRRVNRVLRLVDYRPDPVARTLASGRLRRIAALIPSFCEGEYWADVDRGIARAEAVAGRYRVSVHRIHFDQYDRLSFLRALEELRREAYDGVLLATLFAADVAPLAEELADRDIPCVFVDADIPGCRRLAFFGTSSADAGAVAARLLTDRIPRDADILVGSIVHRGDEGSNQCRLREEGFRSYLDRCGFRGRLHSVALHIRDERRNTRLLDELLRTHPRIAGAVTFNSTSYILGRYLERSGRRDIRLVGYDIIPANERMLLSGTATALIAQRPEAQGHYAIMALCERLAGAPPPADPGPMPIDILLRENIAFYKNNIF